MNRWRLGSESEYICPVCYRGYDDPQECCGRPVMDRRQYERDAQTEIDIDVKRERKWW